ncbi:hypothetical protein [Virgibacillus salexigens]|uniref:hypothetical protein n=1 Tax=Virgibacillus TaxID=84406 RepID=UPI00137150D4|nr:MULTISPECIES: hypothetical protein [Virgibacillus]MYL42761.1 hypothetical protein [Virgibacillus massiliensis]
MHKSYVSYTLVILFAAIFISGCSSMMDEPNRIHSVGMVQTDSNTDQAWNDTNVYFREHLTTERAITEAEFLNHAAIREIPPRLRKELKKIINDYRGANLLPQ